MKVGVRELKAKLSEYVERAAGGEVIEVTDRGEPRALLTPLAARSRLAEGLADGWIAPPLRGSKARGKAPRRVRAERTVEAVLREDRGR